MISRKSQKTPEPREPETFNPRPSFSQPKKKIIFNQSIPKPSQRVPSFISHSTPSPGRLHKTKNARVSQAPFQEDSSPRNLILPTSTHNISIDMLFFPSQEPMKTNSKNSSVRDSFPAPPLPISKPHTSPISQPSPAPARHPNHHISPLPPSPLQTLQFIPTQFIPISPYTHT